jgi:Gluconate 2-dehydrogenase subunit 3
MSDDITRRLFIGSAAVIMLAPVADAASEQAATSRRTLRAAIDRIIPAQGKMPAASAVGGVEYLEALSARDQDIQQRLAQALTTLGPSFGESSENEQISALERLEQTDPAAFSALRDTVYEAYYTSPNIWALIGYSFRKGNKKTAALEAFDTKLLAGVQQLPRLYRETD